MSSHSFPSKIVTLKLLIAGSLFVVLVDSTCDVKNSFDDGNAETILEAHNNMRSQIAKGTYKVLNGSTTLAPATNMRKMAWSCDLQKAAQEWVLKQKNCQMKRSKVSGENLFAQNVKRVSVKEVGLVAINSWERELNTNGWSDEKYERIIGHATQMAWWNSDKIGCGYNMCKNRVLVVCRYQEGGNYYGVKAYEAGKTCSNCGKDFKCEKESGFCIPV